MKRYDSMGFENPHGVWVRWADVEAAKPWLASALQAEIEKEERAIAEWNREYPQLPWKDEHPAMQRLAVMREILSLPAPTPK